MAVPGLEKYWGTETFVTEALTLEAIKALNKAKKYNQPFYLYMSQYAIHVPLDKDKRFYDKYKKKGMTDHEAAYATLIQESGRSDGLAGKKRRSRQYHYHFHERQRRTCRRIVLA